MSLPQLMVCALRWRTLEARIKVGQAAYEELRKLYAAELRRLTQVKTRVDLELRRLRAPYANDREGLAENDTKMANAPRNSATVGA